MTTDCFKILVCGSEGSGKSSILRRFKEDTFSDEYFPTGLYEEILLTVTTDNGESIHIDCFDTGGNREYEQLSIPIVTGIKAGIVVYDISDQTSTERIQDDCKNCYRYGRKTLRVLVGNKCDKKREVDKTDIEEFAKKENILHFETSAKTNTNVREMIMSIANRLVEKPGDEKHQIVEKSQTVEKNQTVGKNKMVENSPTVNNHHKDETSQGVEKHRTVEKSGTVEKSETSSCCVIN